MSGPSFAERIGEYLGKPFRRGGRGPEDYDCYGFVHSFGRGMGWEIPEAQGDYTIDTWQDLYDRDPVAAEEIMIAALTGAGDPVESARIVAGDILVLRHPSGGRYPAVYAGGGLVAASFLGAGVRTIRFDRRDIVLARRFR